MKVSQDIRGRRGLNCFLEMCSPMIPKKMNIKVKEKKMRKKEREREKRGKEGREKEIKIESAA